MGRRMGVLFLVVVVLSLGLSGCGPKKAASSSEAISASNVMKTVEEKTNYLVSQAKTFYNSKDFQGAIDIAQHILAYVDKDSQEAKDLLMKAKDALEAKARAAAEDLKNKIGNLGK